MRIGKLKKVGVGVVAAATLAGGAAVAAPAVAMADAPTVTVEQDVSDLTVTTKDTVGNQLCLPILVSGETALEVGVAYATQDWGRIGELLTSGGDNVKFGAAASGVRIPIIGTQPLPNPSTTEWTPADGVYLLMGTCTEVSGGSIVDIIRAIAAGDFSALLGDLAENLTIQPVIVPNGIGSIAPAAGFGSLALQAGSTIIADQIGG
ncbi:hypothetical protein [Tomitella fengzijianii]|uniref:Secreted protein n=1 Tax=Tomitella fengzijianii TaxID=2597660 RepID=A0A516X600_9ACTN|nr:hypothetical protein [Tomitella fengzijianii]QDQ98505.1 hypothetical protein FO059_15740 [Tomitella fengzijianii]